MTRVLAPSAGRDWVALTSLPLPVDAANAWVTTPGSGAVVSFLGVVREHSEGRSGVRGLTYEAYEDAATRRLGEIAEELRRRWPDVERCLGNDPPVIGARCGCAMLVLPPLQFLVSVLDHDDGRIDHGPDGDRDAGQRHYVRLDPLSSHDEEGAKDAQRQGDDRDQR